MNIKTKFHKYKLGILFLTLLLTFTSCDTEEILNPAPITSLSDLNAFDTPDRVLAQINGLYASLKSGQFLGGRMQVYHEVRGEDFQNRLGNGVTALFAWNHGQNPSNAEPLNAWSNGYLTINRCNVFLQGLDDNPDVIDATLANQYRGEARFVRAMAYYFMVNLYARPYAYQGGNSPGLPLRLLPETGPGNRELARSTVAEVYDQILADLNFAEQNVPANYSSAALNVTRIHTNTVIAFKTRVLLTMQRYADVITEAQKIIPQTVAPFSTTSGVTHALAANVATVYAPPYTSSESIFSLAFSTNDVPGTQNSLGHYFTKPGVGNGEYNYDPAGILASAAFTADDARRTALLETVSGRTYSKKFPLNPYTDFAPIIRYAEILLNYAEALARVNNTVDATALELLNAVRGRSAPAAVYTAGNFADANALIDAILLERRIELACEGFRGIDIMRLQLDLPAKTGVQGSVPLTAQNYIWPIPQAEIDNNALMVQN